jgi:hypothetical protein
MSRHLRDDESLSALRTLDSHTGKPAFQFEYRPAAALSCDVHLLCHALDHGVQYILPGGANP